MVFPSIIWRSLWQSILSLRSLLVELRCVSAGHHFFTSGAVVVLYSNSVHVYVVYFYDAVETGLE